MTENIIISKKEKETFLNPSSRFIGDAYLKKQTKDEKIALAQHRLYNHYKLLIGHLFDHIASNKEYFSMIDAILCYYGNNQTISILLAIIRCDHKYRLTQSHTQNIESLINHNFYKYDIINTEYYMDYLNDLCRSYSNQNEIEKICNSINKELLAKCHDSTLTLLQTLKNSLNHSIINHQIQIRFIEWFLSIILDIFKTESVIKPFFDYHNDKNKHNELEIVFDTVTKNQILRSILKGANFYNMQCIEPKHENNQLIVCMDCGENKCVKVEIGFKMQNSVETNTENIGENDDDKNSKLQNMNIRISNREAFKLKHWVSDDVDLLKTVISKLVHLYVGILIPHKIRKWKDLWIEIRGYVDEHIADVQQRISSKILSIVGNDNYLHSTQSVQITKNIQKYSILLYCPFKEIAFEKVSILYSQMHIDSPHNLCFAELKSMAENETDKRLQATKEKMFYQRVKSKKWEEYEYKLSFCSDKHEFIVLPKLVHRFKKHIASLINKAKPIGIEHKVMTALGPFEHEKLDKMELYEKKKKIEPKDSKVPIGADMKYHAPCFAFHCTARRNLDSITKEGLKKGGDYIEATGKQLPISHGSRWGTGVYLSCDYTLARHYAGTDVYDRQAVLVNLVHLGKCHVLSQTEVDIVNNYNRNKHGTAILPCYHSTPDIYGYYRCGANTHISPDGKQIICGSALQCLPVLITTVHQSNVASANWKLSVKTLSLRSVYAMSKDYQWLNNVISGKRKSQKINKNKVRLQGPTIHFSKLCDLSQLSGSQKQTHKKSKLVNVHDDLWSFKLNEEILSNVGLESVFKMKRVKLLFCIDTSKTMKIGKCFTKRVLPACSQIFRDLQPDSTGAIFFGDEIETFPFGSIKTAQTFANPDIVNKKLSNYRNLVGCFEKMIDCVTSDYKKSEKSEKWETYNELKSDLYRGSLKDHNFGTKVAKGNTINIVCKNIIRSCVNQAVGIGRMNLKNKTTAMLKRKTERRRSNKDNVYVIVLFVGGSDTKNGANAMKDFLKRYEFVTKQLKNELNGIKIIIKIVGLNKCENNFYAPLAVKYMLQTVNVYEPKPIYYCPKKKLLSVVAKQVIEDLQLLSGTNSIFIRLAYNECILGEGFVGNLTKSPDWNICIRLSPNSDYTVLFRGRVPSKLVFEKKSDCGYWTSEHDVPCTQDRVLRNDGILSVGYAENDYENILAMIQSMVSDLKIACLAKRNVDGAVKILRFIVCVIKERCLKQSVEGMHKIEIKERLIRMKRNKQLIFDLETVMNDIVFIVDYAKSKENITKNIEWIANIKKMKFGKKTVQRVKKYQSENQLNAKNILTQLLSIKQEYFLMNDQLQIEGQKEGDIEGGIEGGIDEEDYKENEGQMAVMAYDSMKSASSKSSPWSHLLDIFETLDVVMNGVDEHLNFVDLLYCLGIVGIPIRCRRFAASDIDPWQLKVEYVAHCYNDSVSAMCALDSKCDIFENKHKQCLMTTTTKNDENGNEYVPDLVMILNRMHYKSDYVKHKLLMNVMRSDLYSIYMASVFTRNPNLVIPSQKIALLMISFVQNIQQIFLRNWAKEQNEKEIKIEINNALNLMFCIRAWIGQIDKNKDGYWYTLINKLFKDHPGRFMTTSQTENVSTVCKVLCAICCFDECAKLFDEHSKFYKASKSSTNMKQIKAELTQCQLSKIAIAMIGESTSRECRILVNKNEEKMWKLIAKCFGVSRKKSDDEIKKYDIWYNGGNVHKGILFDDSFNTEKATKASAKFFEKRLMTNCTPHSIVGCLGFAQCIHKFIKKQTQIETIWDLLICDDVQIQTNLIDFVYQRFKSKKITMRSFIKQYLPVCNAIHVQIALYVQGLRYHTSKTRRDGLPELIDPLPIIRKIASGFRQHRFEEYVKEKNKQKRAELEQRASQCRYTRLLMEQEDFLQTHSFPETPKIFSHAEIKAMNAHRDAKDQLELMECSGLLKHHCCYPKCPYFLVNLATEKDKIMNERHGMWKHLKYFMYPKNVHLKGFHVNAKRLIRGGCKSKERFAEQMKKVYRRTNVENFACSDDYDKTYHVTFRSHFV